MLQTSSQRNKVNRELQRLGFGNLKDPRLHLQFAAVIRDHAHFRGILMHIPEGLDRKQWYEALAPNVRFKAKPLADYEMESKQLAESNQLPSYDPVTLKVEEFKVPQFDSEFRRIEEFDKARADNRGKNELLPQDKLASVAEEAIHRDLREGQAKMQNTLICHKCTKQQVFRMKYRSSLFKLAAEAGWLIENLKAFCPDCKPTVQ
jgi:hypothetical protein